MTLRVRAKEAGVAGTRKVQMLLFRLMSEVAPAFLHL